MYIKLAMHYLAFVFCFAVFFFRRAEVSQNSNKKKGLPAHLFPTFLSTFLPFLTLFTALFSINSLKNKMKEKIVYTYSCQWHVIQIMKQGNKYSMHKQGTKSWFGQRSFFCCKKTNEWLQLPSLNFLILVASVHQLAFEFLPQLQFYKLRQERKRNTWKHRFFILGGNRKQLVCTFHLEANET